MFEGSPSSSAAVIAARDVTAPERGWIDVGKAPKDRLAQLARVVG